ncbi:MAG: hypothetical protein C5S49_04185 [Candidatus Methanogaster sp.]|nr:MAG: hypothetical protein C5S49_04185 [ANME-2 cluster archaeon]
MAIGVNMNLGTLNANYGNTDNQALRKRCTDVRTLYPLAWTDAAGTAMHSNPHSEGERYYIQVRSDRSPRVWTGQSSSYSYLDI